jgi:hypothetical protein
MSDKKNKDLELNIAEEQNNQENINKKNLQDVKKAIEDRVND